jgi:hypothetical protein
MEERTGGGELIYIIELKSRSDVPVFHEELQFPLIRWREAPKVNIISRRMFSMFRSLDL